MANSNWNNNQGYSFGIRLLFKYIYLNFINRKVLLKGKYAYC
jgi:hypothetical protein